MRKQVKFQKYEWEQNLRMTLIYCRLYRCRRNEGVPEIQRTTAWGGKILY